MASVALPAPPRSGAQLPAVYPPAPVRRFTVQEYHRMIEVGILTDDDDVELLEGWIIPKMSRNHPHDSTIEFVDEALRALLPGGWRLRIQSAITTSDSEPEPDLTVVQGSARSREGHHPVPREIGIVVEVADSTLAQDRTEKQRIYARAALPMYWIINLVDRQVEVYTDPTGPDPVPQYRQVQVFQPGDNVPLVIAGQQVGLIPVASLLPA